MSSLLMKCRMRTRFPERMSFIGFYEPSCHTRTPSLFCRIVFCSRSRLPCNGNKVAWWKLAHPVCRRMVADNYAFNFSRNFTTIFKILRLPRSMQRHFIFLPSGRNPQPALSFFRSFRCRSYRRFSESLDPRWSNRRPFPVLFATVYLHLSASSGVC